MRRLAALLASALLCGLLDASPPASRAARPLLAAGRGGFGASVVAHGGSGGVRGCELVALDGDVEANELHAQTPSDRKRRKRRLFLERCAVLLCLFSFTFFNGVARRSLSSSGPSLVAEGLITEDRAEEVFTKGFEAFVVGKLLVIPTLAFLGEKAALLLQVAVVTLGCAALWIAPGVPLVQSGAWVLLRIFSAMATSTTLPFVGAWFPRAAYGRAFGWIFTGFQAGYLFVSVYFQRLLFSASGLHWTVPFAFCTIFGACLFVACAAFLHERPLNSLVAQPSREKGGGLKHAPRAAGEESEGRVERQKPQLLKLFDKIRTRWVFWGMVVTVFGYSPIVEYSTHVTSYLREMASLEKPIRNGFVCLSHNLCESRYRKYVFSYVSALLVGSFFYDRATQLDRTLLVLGLYVINIVCWVLLALSEPSQVPAIIASNPGPTGLVGRIVGLWRGNSASSAADQLVSSVVLPLSTSAKATLASLAGATIALPSSLPFAIFSLDFGKEGAAILSGILSAVSMVAAIIFLRMFPVVRLRFGWFGVHSWLAGSGLVAALAMASIMLTDYRKFSRGYIIQSSLANETVVTLHACSQPSCSHVPMWRPGSRRVWTAYSGRGLGALRAHVPNRYCHNCGKAELLECKVKNSASEAALFTPFERCTQWILDTAPLRKPKGGWAFSDPLRFPLAPEATYGDRKAYERRLERNEDDDSKPTSGPTVSQEREAT